MCFWCWAPSRFYSNIRPVIADADFRRAGRPTPLPRCPPRSRRLLGLRRRWGECGWRHCDVRDVALTVGVLAVEEEKETEVAAALVPWVISCKLRRQPAPVAIARAAAKTRRLPAAAAAASCHHSSLSLLRRPAARKNNKQTNTAPCKLICVLLLSVVVLVLAWWRVALVHRGRSRSVCVCGPLLGQRPLWRACSGVGVDWAYATSALSTFYLLAKYYLHRPPVQCQCRHMLLLLLLLAAVVTAASNCQPGFAAVVIAVSNTTNTTLCLSCPVGRFTDAANSTICTFCQAGYFNNLSTASTCNLCAPGQFGTQPAASMCQMCDNGRFAPNAGSTSCMACGDGACALGAGATGCVVCDSSAAPTPTPTTAAPTSTRTAAPTSSNTDKNSGLSTAAAIFGWTSLAALACFGVYQTVIARRKRRADDCC